MDMPLDPPRPPKPDRPRIKTRHPGVYYRERPDGSRSYMIWYRGTDGKARFENVPGNEGDAKRARAKVINDMAHGHKVAPTGMLFADFARSWMDEQTNLAPKSVEGYRGAIEVHLIPRLGPRVKLSDVDVNRVARLIASMQKDGYRVNTIRSVLKPLSRMMTIAARRGMVTVNPVTLLDRSERPRGDVRKPVILDTDEIKAMLDHAPAHHRIMLATSVFTGVRIGELLALRWEDVDWAEGVLHVEGTKTTDSVREVVLMPALQQKLSQLSLELRQDSGIIFPISRTAVRYALSTALKKAGIEKKLRVHDLRHTFASILLGQGHDPSYVAGQMGHSNSIMTLRTYGHLIDRAKKRQEARDRMQASFGQLLGQAEVLLVEPNQQNTGI